MRTWLDVPAQSTFGVHALPYGVFSTSGEEPRIGVGLGDHVLDLAPLAATEGLAGAHVFTHDSLNPFLAMGRRAWDAVRGWIIELITEEPHRELVEAHLVPVTETAMHLPITIPDYVDFYSSQVHAENVGKIFRPGLPPLPAAWRQMPLGYHGRTGTIVVSGTRIPRPKGLHARGDTLDYGPSARLDIEAEVGFIVGTPSELGQPVPIADFSQHVFGLIVVNDWSARDIQAAEYVPLGPFLGKSFATSISPWVVPLAAVEHARIAPPPQQPEPAAYLRDAQPWGLDIALEIEWNGTIVSQPMFAEMYWTPAQQLAHLTANGARVRSGDLYASGTVSSTGTGQVGSFLELTWNGTQPVKLADGSKRGFLEDGDVVTIRASAPGPDHTTITLGEVTGQIIPSR